MCFFWLKKKWQYKQELDNLTSESQFISTFFPKQEAFQSYNKGNVPEIENLWLIFGNQDKIDRNIVEI